MGFIPQPNTWQCGPYALRHALLALGIVADEALLTRVSGATEEGADERDLDRAARHVGCALECERLHDAAAARRALAAHLAVPRPVLLCVDQWTHWVAVVGMEQDAVIALDSRASTVWQIIPWRVLATRLAYPAAGGRAWYDLHPVVPGRASARPGRFSRARVEHLCGPDGRELSRDWSRYLAELIPVSRAAGPQTEWTVSIGDTLRARATALLDGLPTRGMLLAHRRLAHAAFVADTHALDAALDHAAQLDAIAARMAQDEAA
jgi:hypothetical protein